MFYTNQLLQKKTFIPMWITWARENSSESTRVKRESRKLWERLLRTILFCSGHLQHERERPEMERKEMNSDKAKRKERELTTQWSGTVGGGTTYKASKVAFSDINHNRKLRRSPRNPYAGGVACRQKWHSIDTCLKHIQNHNFSRTVARKFSIGGLWQFCGGGASFVRGTWHYKINQNSTYL